MKYPPRCVFPEWIFSLPMQQQSVLLLGSRGPDGIGKFHPCKDITRAYRATVFKAAYYGRALAWGEEADTFMALDLIAVDSEWQRIVKAYFDAIDGLPHHYHAHLTHGAEILGYKHPDEAQRRAWYYFYQESVRDAHMNPETEEEMDRRLGDWGQKHWDDELSKPQAAE